IETRNPGKESESRKTTYFLYDSWNVIAELTFGRIQELEDGSQNALSVNKNPIPAPSAQLLNSAGEARYHTWGRDISGSLQGAGGVGGLLAVTEGEREQEDSSSWILASKFFLYDANGNVSQLLDDSGAITAAY